MKKTTTPNIAGCILIAAMLLSACAAGTAGGTPTGGTPAPTGGTEGPSAYPFPYPYPEPGIDPGTAYPTLPPDTPVTAGPANPYPPAEGEPLPFAPQAGDASLNRGEVFVEQTDVLTLESFPPQFVLTLAGSLPTPCHQLRVEIASPNSNDDIEVTVYSVVDPNTMCTQVLEPFEARVPLEGMPSGSYTVLVNGEAAGEIDVP